MSIQKFPLSTVGSVLAFSLTCPDERKCNACGDVCGQLLSHV